MRMSGLTSSNRQPPMKCRARSPELEAAASTTSLAPSLTPMSHSSSLVEMRVGQRAVVPLRIADGPTLRLSTRGISFASDVGGLAADRHATNV